MTLLTEPELQQVAEAIERVERDTDAELVTVLAAQADDYRYIPLLWASLLALPSSDSGESSVCTDCPGSALTLAGARVCCCCCVGREARSLRCCFIAPRSPLTC